MDRYDVLVIGSGPGGEKAALQAAKLHKRVAIIEKSPYIGGAGLQTWTLPSKTLWERPYFSPVSGRGRSMASSAISTRGFPQGADAPQGIGGAEPDGDYQGAFCQKRHRPDLWRGFVQR